MTKPQDPDLSPVKDGDAPSGTWPGEVPGSGESPLQDLHASDTPADPAVSGDVPDPGQLASAGPAGAPQPVPREDDPGINENVVS